MVQTLRERLLQYLFTNIFHFSDNATVHQRVYVLSKVIKLPLKSIFYLLLSFTDNLFEFRY